MQWHESIDTLFHFLLFFTTGKANRFKWTHDDYEEEEEELCGGCRPTVAIRVRDILRPTKSKYTLSLINAGECTLATVFCSILFREVGQFPHCSREERERESEGDNVAKHSTKGCGQTA